MNKEFFTKVTPFSKIVALALFVLLPFMGFYLGVMYQKKAETVNEQAANTDNRQMEENVEENYPEEMASDEEEEGDKGESGDESEDDQAVATAYSGTAIDAEVPAGWSIVEYFDGAGSDMLVSGVTYQGLTGLEIKHGADVIFKLKAVSGIGGISACSEVVEFSDTDPAYITDVVNDAAAQGITTTVIDHTGTTYSEFLVFANRMRRISHDLYWDMDMTNHSFEPNCGLDSTAFPAYGLEFLSDPGTAMEMANTTYWYEIDPTATTAELDTMETILGAIEVL